MKVEGPKFWIAARGVEMVCGNCGEMVGLRNGRCVMDDGKRKAYELRDHFTNSSTDSS